MSDVTISIIDGGPYKVEGGVTLTGPDGSTIPTAEGKAVFLCRCGHSANKPFCDGSHNRVEWDSALAQRG